MRHFLLLLICLLFLCGFSFEKAEAQCSCSSSCLNSLGTGNWNDCTKWNGVSCIGWATATIMGNMQQVILSGHTITVPLAISTYHARSEGLYIQSGGTLVLNGAINGEVYSASKIAVCGTMNVNFGTSDFSTATLYVNNGGVLNINGGILYVNDIVVESGGIINLSGGELRYKDYINGIWVKTGGLININNGSSKLNYNFSSTLTTTVDGTVDCKNVLTNSNYNNFDFGLIMVSSGTSTGLIRTQTAYIPSNNTWSAANNFFGYNSDYGGTVEYYGSSAISFGMYSQQRYHTLKISNTNASCVSLYSTNCYSTSILNLANTASFIYINSAKLFIRGTVQYTGNSYIKTSSNSNLAVHGYLGASTICADLSTGVVATVSSENASVNIMQPLLKFSPTGGSTGYLNNFDIYREDVVTINDNVTVSGSLSVRRGILKTNSYILYLSNTLPSSLTYNTVGYTAAVGWVSGNLKRACNSGLTYDFPVGRTDVTTFAIDYPKYRHFRLELTSVTASPCNIKVNFNTVFNPDVCNGTLINAWDDGVNYNQLHPEGWWSVIPDAGITTTTYNARGYIYGFTGAPAPVNNKYGLLKRPDGSSLCSDWTNGGGTLNPTGTSGRIHEYSGSLEIGYAQRNGLSSFSEFAIGVTDGPLPVELIDFSAKCSVASVTLSWSTATETNNDYFTIEKSINAEDWVPVGIVDGAGNSNELINYEFEDNEPMSGTSYYRLKQTDFDGQFEYFGPVTVNCSEGANGIIAYPNPAQENVVVVGSLDVAANIYLCDITGRIITTYSCSHLSEPFSIDLQNILPGIYLIRVDSQNSSEYFRLVKE